MLILGLRDVPILFLCTHSPQNYYILLYGTQKSIFTTTSYKVVSTINFYTIEPMLRHQGYIDVVIL